TGRRGSCLHRTRFRVYLLYDTDCRPVGLIPQPGPGFREPAPMPETIQTRCPNCRTAFQVPAAVAGKKIRCKNCQPVFTVAAPGSPPPAGGDKPRRSPPAAETFKLADDEAPNPGTAKPLTPAAPGPPGAP